MQQNITLWLYKLFIEFRITQQLKNNTKVNK